LVGVTGSGKEIRGSTSTPDNSNTAYTADDETKLSDNRNVTVPYL